jgi:hypothetical protein
MNEFQLKIHLQQIGGDDAQRIASKLPGSANKKGKTKQKTKTGSSTESADESFVTVNRGEDESFTLGDLLADCVYKVSLSLSLSLSLSSFHYFIQ